DSPVALAAWMIDHDTDSYQKIARAFVDGQPSGNLTQEHIVDNITLYWLTGTGASAARSYWEEGQENARADGQAPTPVSIPVGFGPAQPLSRGDLADHGVLGRAGLPPR